MEKSTFYMLLGVRTRRRRREEMRKEKESSPTSHAPFVIFFVHNRKLARLAEVLNK
ncbi:hypothetical protein PIB30_091981 [Stylosanthes scabra]|uniref:Uncharacterized protein n=1 Tax=Stylosanthes scabra TaxID=79078 RepID=A0ABU6VXX9_9FABA|nr:hypothetical protein [Stylosanthes scabra]